MRGWNYGRGRGGAQGTASRTHRHADRRRIHSPRLRPLHPRRNVALNVQHAPDVDVVAARDVEDQVWMVRERPGPQTGEIQLMRVAQRADCWMSTDLFESVLQFIDEADRRLLGILCEVVRKAIIYALAGSLAQRDALRLYRLAADLPARVTRCATRRSKRRLKGGALLVLDEIQKIPSWSETVNRLCRGPGRRAAAEGPAARYRMMRFRSWNRFLERKRINW